MTVPPRPELVHVAQSAGFLQLQGSDLVFNSGSGNDPEYYDFVLSCRRLTDRHQAIAYLAKLDDRTNIVEIQQFKICTKKLQHLKGLASSDLTIVALSFHVWKSILKSKKVLVLVENKWMEIERKTSKCASTFSSLHDDKQTVYASAVECVIKMAEKYDIIYHIQTLQQTNDLRNTSLPRFLPKRLAIMLRLMMCQGQPILLEIPEKLIKQFHSFVEPRKWFPLWCL